MKKLLLFLARLTAVSLLFVPFLTVLHRAYQDLIEAIGTWPPGEYDSSPNLYTFLVLILGIPGLALWKRLVAIATGIVLFPGIDLFMIVIWPEYLKTPRPSLANMAVSYGWLMTAHYLLPFVLWFAFAFREIEEFFKGKTAVKTAQRPLR